MFTKKFYHFTTVIILLILFSPFVYKISSNGIFSNTSDFYSYLKAGSNGKDLLTSFGYTLLFMFVSVLGQLIIGIYAAYITFFSSKPKFYIVVFFLPYILPLFLSTLSIRLGFETNGYITNISRNIFSKTFYPLTNGHFHLFVIILLSIWQYFPFVYIFSYTMMKRINNGYIMSSITDGASDLNIFKKVLLPNIKKIILPLIMLRMLFMFNKYDIIVLFAKTNNPQKTLYLLPLYLARIFNNPNQTINNYGLLIVFFTMIFFIFLWFIIRKIFNLFIEKI